MATASRRKTGTVTELVLQQHDGVNVFQLMRLLLAEKSTALPIEKRLRFRANLSAAFPAREFSKLAVRTYPAVRNAAGLAVAEKQQAEVIEISTANYCVASILGPLPEPFTEWVRDLERVRDPAMADFLNMFNQRLNVLRYQLKASKSIGLNTLPPARTPHAHALAALMGLGLPKLAAQVPLHPRAWLGLAGLLANSRKSASTVVHVLQLFLGAKLKTHQPHGEKLEGAKVTMVPLIGAWKNIEAEDRISLGRRSHRLGQQSVIGRRVWDQQARIRLIIAPVDYKRLCQLLPPNSMERRAERDAGAMLSKSSIPLFTSQSDVLQRPSSLLLPRAGEGNQAIHLEDVPYFKRFVGLLQLLLDGLVDCEIELHVDSATVPHPILFAPALPVNVGLRLGQTAWLRSGMPRQTTRPVRYLIPAYGRVERLEAA